MKNIRRKSATCASDQQHKKNNNQLMLKDASLPQRATRNGSRCLLKTDRRHAPFFFQISTAFLAAGCFFARFVRLITPRLIIISLSWRVPRSKGRYNVNSNWDSSQHIISVIMQLPINQRYNKFNLMFHVCALLQFACVGCVSECVVCALRAWPQLF